MIRKISAFSIFGTVCLLGFGALVAAEPGPSSQRAETPSAPANESLPALAPAPAIPVPVTTDPGYRLASGDTISVVVQGEPDLTVTQTLGRSGEIRLQLITSDVSLSGKSVREAEAALETLYRDRKLLKTPVIRVSVAGYARREVWVTGAVRNPGPVSFTGDSTSMDIADAITRAGGFIPLSKADAVRIFRRLPDGKEGPPQIVDLESMVSTRYKPGRDRAEIMVYPGDRIFVPDRIF